MKSSNIAMVNAARILAKLAKNTAASSEDLLCLYMFHQPKVPVGLKEFAKNNK